MDERDIFIQVIQAADPAQGAALVQKLCDKDQPLRQRVEALLDAHGRAASFLEISPSELANTPVLDQPPLERPGTQIGPYKLLQQIGEGGFGVVFMAEQLEPVRRKVAVKVIKPGMDTRQVIARFEAERQALAVMDHPNIAKVLDAGTTGQVRSAECGVRNEELDAASNSASIPHSIGRPYFVMELVRGIPITQYCDENNLPVRERGHYEGVFPINAARRMADILDGTSHTILIAECAGRPQLWQGRRQVASVWLSGGPWASRNLLWCRGATPDGTGFFGTCAVNCTNDREVYSFHPSGANAVLADGSARFLSAHIDIRIFAGLVTRADGEVDLAGDF